jgi:xanthine dehydrogenase YagS FAD-binding subunit
MQRFAYRRASSTASAVHMARSATEVNQAHAQRPSTADTAVQFIAGGTNMTDYMTLNVLKPATLVDISRLPRESHARIESDATGGLRLGALVRMSQAEDHPVIRGSYPLIRDTLVLAASRQIRNMATLGGNILQRTRCEYYREPSWPCNKRSPGSGCAALDGVNRQHAVLGTSEHCIATYAGDFAQALIALDASIETLGGPRGARRIAFADLHRLPGTTPHIEHTLAPGELITFIDVPAGPWTVRSRYVKVRDRESYQFAVTSAAVALHLEGRTVREARIALGGVATVPWRARQAEELLKGRVLDETLAMKAAEAALVGAQPRKENAFKIPLTKHTLVRALLEAQAMQV